MIEAWLVIYLLAAHFVADFVCQTTWMGLNKSKSNWILTLHVLIYTAVIAFLADGFVESPLTFAALNGILHWPIDWISSRLAGKYHREGRLYAFWKVIGLDQLAHMTCLILLA